MTQRGLVSLIYRTRGDHTLPFGHGCCYLANECLNLSILHGSVNNSTSLHPYQYGILGLWITSVHMTSAHWWRIRIMVFNVTFSNISVVSWQSVLLVEKTTDLSRIAEKTLSYNVVASTPCLSWISLNNIYSMKFQHTIIQIYILQCSMGFRSKL